MAIDQSLNLKLDQKLAERDLSVIMKIIKTKVS